MSLVDEAVRFATDLGFNVLPCSAAKRPAIPESDGGNGYYDATDHPPDIRALFARAPHARLVGSWLGPKGKALADIDVRDGKTGDKQLRALEAIHGPLPATVTGITPSGGTHYYFADPQGIVGGCNGLKDDDGTEHPHIDLRGWVGYVILPTEGSGYQWAPGRAPWEIGYAPIPNWLAKYAPRPARASGNGSTSTQTGRHTKWRTLDPTTTEGRTNREALEPEDLAALVLLEQLGGHSAYRTDREVVVTRPGKTLRDRSAAIGFTEPGKTYVTSGAWPDLPSGWYSLTELQIHARAAAPRSDGAAPPVDTVEQPTRRLVAQPWHEFAATTPEDVPWLVDSVIPDGGEGVIGGRPKGGKTWLAVDLAVSVATGTPFIGRYAADAAPVVYVALEGHRAAIRARIAATARSRGVEPLHDPAALAELHVVYKPRGLSLLDATWAAELAALVADTGARLVIVDTLRRAAVIRETNEGVADLARLRDNLAPLAASGCAVTYVHHFRKSGGDDVPAGELLSGSGALFGAIDFGLYVTKPTKAPVAFTLDSDGRDGPTFAPLVVQLQGIGSGENGAITALDAVALVVRDTDSEGAAIDEERARGIAGWLERDHPGERVTPKTIRDTFGIDGRTLGRCREPLRRHGVEYVEAGRGSHYRHPGTPANNGHAGVLPNHPGTPANPFRGAGVVPGSEGGVAS